jgi:hypothetical protein
MLSLSSLIPGIITILPIIPTITQTIAMIKYELRSPYLKIIEGKIYPRTTPTNAIGSIIPDTFNLSD